MTVIGRGMY